MLRTAAFLLGCMGVRAALAYAASRAGPPALRVMGLAALAVSLSFFVLYATGWRSTGPESSDPGGRIWWAALRPAHGTLYLAFALMALWGRKGAWVPLALDAALGFAAWTAHRFGAWNL